MEKSKSQTDEQKKESRTTNKAFSENNDGFKAACEVAGVNPTVRQASKWRLKKGKAWNDGRVPVA
jgi:hypothetical protein